jgi:hypothetical protein
MTGLPFFASPADKGCVALKPASEVPHVTSRATCAPCSIQVMQSSDLDTWQRNSGLNLAFRSHRWLQEIGN